MTVEQAGSRPNFVWRNTRPIAKAVGVLLLAGSATACSNPFDHKKDSVMRAVSYARFSGAAACQKPKNLCNAPIYSIPLRSQKVSQGGNADLRQEAINKVTPRQVRLGLPVYPHEAGTHNGKRYAASLVKVVCQVEGGPTTGRDGTSTIWDVVEVPAAHLNDAALKSVEAGRAPFGYDASQLVAYGFMASPWLVDPKTHIGGGTKIDELGDCNKTQNPQHYAPAHN